MIARFSPGSAGPRSRATKAARSGASPTATPMPQTAISSSGAACTGADSRPRMPRRRLLEDDVGVVAAEAEGVDRGAPRAFGLPRLGAGEDAHRRLADRLDRVLGVDRRRQRARLESAEDLDDRGRPGRGDQVAEIGLERAHRQVVGAGEDRRHAPDLDRVADAGAGGVALDVADRQRVDAAAGIGLAHGADLAAAVGREQAALAAVVGEADAADHGEDTVAGIDRVVESFQGEERRALRREQPVGVPGERTASAARRQRRAASRSRHGGKGRRRG